MHDIYIYIYMCVCVCVASLVGSHLKCKVKSEPIGIANLDLSGQWRPECESHGVPWTLQTLERLEWK